MDCIGNRRAMSIVLVMVWPSWIFTAPNVGCPSGVIGTPRFDVTVKSIQPNRLLP